MYLIKSDVEISTAKVAKHAKLRKEKTFVNLCALGVLRGRKIFIVIGAGRTCCLFSKSVDSCSPSILLRQERKSTVNLAILHGQAPANALQPVADPGQSAAFVPLALTIRGGRIASVNEAPDAALPTLDVSGCTILPGFIDLHVHGGAGHDTMDATPAALAAMAAFFAQHGVTAFLPTTMTAPHVDIRRAVAAVGALSTQSPDGARMLGVHVEGPYISPVYPGAQPASFIRPPELAEFAELLRAGPVRMITLAPEVRGADALIAAAQDAGVIAVWGHTNATYEECARAAGLGITQATHTYNAMSPLHHRKPGALGATLLLDTIYAQLIADNIHVHPGAMALLARCKGIERTVLITDAMRAAGLPDGAYELGGQGVTVQNGACRLADGTLAGSILTMDQALVNFMAATGLGLATAWPVTSRTPAQALGLAAEFGSLAVGYQCDLVLLDADLAVVATVVGGEVVYLREAGRLKGYKVQ